MTAAVRKGIKISGACLFGIYISGLIYFLFFAESYGRGADSIGYSYNIYPFREIKRYLTYAHILGIRSVILNLAGNVVGFMPFGLLLPLMRSEVRKAWRVTVLGFEISALIELSQLIFKVGCFDVDDIILNTFGAWLGYVLFYLSFRWYQKRKMAAGHKPSGRIPQQPKERRR